jgi:hypothetical protein
MSMEAVFSALAKGLALKDTSVQKMPNGSRSIETNMNSPKVLMQTLKEMGFSPSTSANSISVEVENRSMNWIQVGEGTFNLQGGPSVPVSRMQSHVEGVIKNYSINLQNEIVNQIVSNAASAGYVIESQPIQSGSDICVTLMVNAT